MYQGLSHQIQQVMPRVLATGLFVEIATITKPSGGQTTTGAPDGNETPVIGLEAISCMSSVTSMNGITPNEERTPESIANTAERHVILDGNYTDLLDGWREGWQCTITYPDGTVTNYNMIAVECDSQGTHSRLTVREVTL